MDQTDSPNLVYGEDFLSVRTHRDERVAIQVGRPPEDETPTIVDSRALRDALNVYLGEDDLHEESDDTYTVEVEADVDEALTELHYVRERAEEATDAIHRLQRAIDGLGGETGHTSTPWTERLTGESDGADDAANDDYGTPAPSPSDVQERMEHNDA